MAQAHILVVDDEAELREVLMERLAHAGFTTTGAGSVRDAVRLLGEHTFDLVLSDYHLQDGVGTTVATALRQRHQEAAPPFILMTASLDMSDKQAQALGLEAVFHKPFELKTLTNHITACLKRTERVKSQLEVGLLFQHRLRPLMAKTVNVGQGGMCVELEKSLPEVHDTIRCQIFFEPSGTLWSAEGQVRWVRREAKGELAAGFGVQFLHLTPAKRQVLVEKIGELSTSVEALG